MVVGRRLSYGNLEVATSPLPLPRPIRLTLGGQAPMLTYATLPFDFGLLAYCQATVAWLIVAGIAFAGYLMVDAAYQALWRPLPTAASYECGFSNRRGYVNRRLNLHYWLVAVVLVLFDVEVALVLPSL